MYCVVPSAEKDRRPYFSFLARHQAHTIQYGELAQLGERLVCNQEVTGSSPVFSIDFVAAAIVRGCGGHAARRARRRDLSQLNILQTVVFSDHTHAVCMKLTSACLTRCFDVNSSFLWSSY